MDGPCQWMSVQLNENVLIRINEIQVHDGLWRHIFFSMDYIDNSNQYYLLLLIMCLVIQSISSQSNLSHQSNDILTGHQCSFS